jgi:hypothetical protein
MSHCNHMDQNMLGWLDVHVPRKEIRKLLAQKAILESEVQDLR